MVNKLINRCIGEYLNFQEDTHPMSKLPILPLIDLQKIAVFNLKKYIESSQEKEYDKLIQLYYNCTERLDNRRVYVLLEEASNLMKSFIVKNPTIYFNNLIRLATPFLNEKKFCFEPFLLQIFGNNEKQKGFTQFERLLEKSDYQHKKVLEKFIKKYRNDNNLKNEDLDNGYTVPKNQIYIEDYQSFFGDYIKVNEALRKAIE